MKTILDTAKKIECFGCEKGISMCHMRPCWGTVEDFRKIIKAGHAKKLMIDYYSTKTINKGKNIYFLSGANPDGFNWGYGGSGPAQLALAIMLKLTGDAGSYQDFKFKTIAVLPQGRDFDIKFEL
jgi:hypothetical protein